jgi:hypothetical protein
MLVMFGEASSSKMNMHVACAKTQLQNRTASGEGLEMWPKNAHKKPRRGPATQMRSRMRIEHASRILLQTRGALSEC